MNEWANGDDAVDPLVLSVRADTRSFARDVAEMRAALDGPLVSGADRAGRAIETTLLRAARTGKLGFEDLRRMAVAAMGDIARASIGGGIASILGGGALARGSPGGLLSGLIAAVAGAPGRATGGPVSPGRAYRVGENGPELFVPTSAGQVVPTPAPGPGGRDIRVSITVNAGNGAAPAALSQSSRQVARAVKAALSAMD